MQRDFIRQSIFGNSQQRLAWALWCAAIDRKYGQNYYRGLILGENPKAYAAYRRNKFYPKFSNKPVTVGLTVDAIEHGAILSHGQEDPQRANTEAS